jgi:hypothetical protein
MTKDEFYLLLYDFKNQSMDQQGEITNKLWDLIDGVSDGAWDQTQTELGVFSQCAFCCVSPESGHDETCPVRLARELKDKQIKETF